MRLFCAIRATVLLVCAAASTSHAEGLRSTDSGGSGATPQARVAACNCPSPVYRSSVRRHYAVGQSREWPSYSEVAVAEPPDPYNPYLPGTLDTAYDRAMTLHFRSPAVTDTYRRERGEAPTPPIRGLYPYRVRAWGAVYQYDGLIGQYVALAQSDAGRVSAAAVPTYP
jgi:hypothetical protein